MEQTTAGCKPSKYESNIEDGSRTVRVLNFHTNEFKEIRFYAIEPGSVKTVSEVRAFLLKTLDIPVNPGEYDLIGVKGGTPVIMDQSAPIINYDKYLNANNAHLEFRVK